MSADYYAFGRRSRSYSGRIVSVKNENYELGPLPCKTQITDIIQDGDGQDQGGSGGGAAGYLFLRRVTMAFWVDGFDCSSRLSSDEGECRPGPSPLRRDIRIPYFTQIFSLRRLVGHRGGRRRWKKVTAEGYGCNSTSGVTPRLSGYLVFVTVIVERPSCYCPFECYFHLPPLANAVPFFGRAHSQIRPIVRPPGKDLLWRIQLKLRFG